MLNVTFYTLFAQVKNKYYVLTLNLFFNTVASIGASTVASIGEHIWKIFSRNLVEYSRKYFLDYTEKRFAHFNLKKKYSQYCNTPVLKYFWSEFSGFVMNGRKPSQSTT
uniref:Uncharacterized protein n=1 Tax=Cacopsylla melanoneura TaxID=428564 RepID=A0A8D8RZK3_9HEMI